jgi:uracil-DNA glycosylase
MITTKEIKLHELWTELAQNTKVTEHFKNRNGINTNIGFVNQYAKNQFIPNKWFDWENRADAKIMIIGQDWGPYSALLKYVTDYEIHKADPNFNYEEFLFKTLSSRTEKFIINSIQNSYIETFNKQIDAKRWNDFIFTVAIMFTRQGNHFRGNEFYDEKFGIEQSLPYLQKLIEIVKPSIIMPLGNVAWGMVKSIFNINISGTISNIIQIQNFQPIKVGDTVIIPNFHPASHTDPKLQYKIWKTIWENLNQTN